MPKLRFIFFLCFLSQLALSKNVVNKRHRLKKITVGPEDNFDPVVSSGALLFSKSSNLRYSIYRQSLEDGSLDILVSPEADSKDARISENGKKVVFTYFGYDAKGDVCTLDLSSKKESCLKRAESIESNPIWLDNEQFIFLRQSKDNLNSSQLIKYDMQREVVLLEGQISSPAVIHGANRIVINERSKSGLHRLLTIDLEGRIKARSQINLPGITGSLSFGSQAGWLYFSQFLNDTNHDQRIDALDHGVVFRVRAENLEQGGAVFPEQLSSSDSNCRLPFPTNDDLYLTCDFEGSLDIYRLPSSGLLPRNWGEKLLWEAHDSARSYQERLLILNVIRYRLQTAKQKKIKERILINHVQNLDFSASKFYANQLKQDSAAEKKEYFSALTLFLKIFEDKLRQSSKVVSLSYAKRLKNLSRQISQVRDEDMRLLLEASLAYSYNHMPTARKQLSNLWKKTKKPEVKYLSLILAKNLYSPEDKVWLNFYRDMLSFKSLNQQSRIYYAYHYLLLINSYSQAKYQKMINLVKRKLLAEDSLLDLFHAESLSRQLASEIDQKKGDSIYREISKIIKSTRSNLQLRRAIYITMLRHLRRAEKFRYMGFIANDWLRYTDLRHAEISYAMEQYTISLLDDGYSYLSKKNYDKASGLFYTAVRSTDDLEAHLQFTKLESKKNGLAGVQKSLSRLKKIKAISSDSERFSRISFELDLIQGRNRDQQVNINELISDLNELNDDTLINPGMKYLSLGVVYHRSMLKKANRYELDLDTFSKAHRAYMLALDLGRDNDRIVARVLENLGRLHFRAGNYELAYGFLSRRTKIGFANQEGKMAFDWLYAKSSYYVDHPEKSYKIMKASLAEGVSEAYLSAFKERAAFYALVSSQWSESSKLYEQLLERNWSTYQEAVLRLSYGYALSKLKRKQHAKKQVLKSLELVPQDAPWPLMNSELLVPFNPLRHRMLAYGLLAKWSQGAKAIKFRESRIAATESLLAKDTDHLFIDPIQARERILQDSNQILAGYLNLRQHQRAKRQTVKSLDYVNKLLQEGGSISSWAASQTMINVISAELHYNLNAPISSSLDKLFTEFHDKSEPRHELKDSVALERRIRLELFELSYRSRISKSMSPEMAQKGFESMIEGVPDAQTLRRLASRILAR